MKSLQEETQKLDKANEIVSNHIHTAATALIDTLIKKQVIKIDCFENLYDAELEEHKEMFEFYLINWWLFSKLKEAGEPVAELPELNIYIWGRTTTGQQVKMDGVIKQIAERYIS